MKLIGPNSAVSEPSTIEPEFNWSTEDQKIAERIFARDTMELIQDLIMKKFQRKDFGVFDYML